MPSFLNRRDPLSLLTHYRFDIMAKYILGKYRYINSSFPLNLYRHHLEVWNDCNEITNSNKSTLEDFIKEFDLLLSSMSQKGFDSTLSYIPTYNSHALNGAHRIAAALLQSCDVWCKEGEPQEGQLDCSHYYLSTKEDYVKGGLSPFYADAMALEYCKLKKNTFILTLFPVASHDLSPVRKIIRKYVDIVYEKSFNLSTNGAFNFIKTLYAGEKWLGDRSNNFHDVNPKLSECYAASGPTVTFLIETNLPILLTELKEEIRDVFKIGKHSAHINDTHAETLRIGQAAFNDNTLHFLNNSKQAYFARFEHLLAVLKNTIIGHHLNVEDFCITASSTLSAYGLREGQDLDYLHASPEHKFVGDPDISSHNGELGAYQHSKDDILYNPKNHFYLYGLKFASLNIIDSLKRKRNEPKDIIDCNLISDII